MTATSTPKPLSHTVERLFHSLLGLKVTVTEKTTRTGCPAEIGLIGVYGTDADTVNGLCHCDLAFANGAAAALARIPPRIANEATMEGECPANLRDNLREILNVCTRLLRRSHYVRLALHDVHCSTEPPENAKELIESQNWTTFEVTIGSYEPGLFSLCTN